MCLSCVSADVGLCILYQFIHVSCGREGPAITLVNNPPVIVCTNWKPTC